MEIRRTTDGGAEWVNMRDAIMKAETEVLGEEKKKNKQDG